LSSSAGRAGFEEAPMSDGTGLRTADRAARLFRAGVLLAGLAAILFVSYGLVAPMPPGWLWWRLPVGIAAVCGLALLLAWPSRRADAKTRTVDEAAAMLGAASMILGIGAAMLGAASMILGIGAAMLVTYGLVLHFKEEQVSTQTLLYRLTHPSVLVSLLIFASPAAVAGGLGLAMARRRARAAGRVSAAATAVRFSIVGLACAGLIAALGVTAVIYRWLTWG
jgi:hypothetical protein